MRALIIDNEVIATIQNCIRYAEQNIVSMDDLLDQYNGQKLPAGDDENRVVHIPVGFRVVFSLEDQPSGKCKHISISIPTSGKLPSVPAVQEIMKQFGFVNDLNIPTDIDVPIKIGVEDIGENRQAISIVEKITNHE